jgi:hypothetical protein
MPMAPASEPWSLKSRPNSTRPTPDAEGRCDAASVRRQAFLAQGEHRHARDSARDWYEHLLWAMDGSFQSGNQGLIRVPLPRMRSEKAGLSTALPHQHEG